MGVGDNLEVMQGERLAMTVDCSGHPAAWRDRVSPGRAADVSTPAGTMAQTVSVEGLAAMRGMGRNEGWAESLDRLAALVDELH
jgi:uncharacterized protein YndB with AHSA1/START domain